MHLCRVFLQDLFSMLQYDKNEKVFRIHKIGIKITMKVEVMLQLMKESLFDIISDFCFCIQSFLTSAYGVARSSTFFNSTCFGITKKNVTFQVSMTQLIF